MQRVFACAIGDFFGHSNQASVLGGKMSFSKRLKSLRLQSEYSQEQLAEMLNVSRQAITKWETAAGLPDIENIIAIANLFDVSIDELLARKFDPAQQPDFLFETSPNTILPSASITTSSSVLRSSSVFLVTMVRRYRCALHRIRCLRLPVTSR